MTPATSDHWAKICRPVVASSGVGARRVKIRGQPPPEMSRRHPSSSCGVGARAGGWPRDAPPHPFKVKLGDHFSAAPEITPGWGLAPGCGTHGTPHRCRSELVGLPRQYTTISATMQLSSVPRPRPSCNSRKRTHKEVKNDRALRLGGKHRSEIVL